MILTNFLVGLFVMLVCLVIQAFVFWCVRYFVRRIRQMKPKPEDYARAGLRPLLVVMVAMMLGTFVQVSIWGGLFVVLGEFSEFYEAVYHSAVNFASLGYGDIVMSKNRKLLGLLEAINGVLMLGMCSCADGHPPAVGEAAVRRRFAGCGRRGLAAGARRVTRSTDRTLHPRIPRARMTPSSSETLTSTLPARLDALPWSRWHWRVVAALGVTWILDGLEVTVVGSLGPALQDPGTLGLSASEIGWAGSAYVAGAVLGALFFGRLADRLGRKPLFLVTLSVYLVATLLTAATFDFESFVFCRFLTGFGIGGEYAAINSAIDELIPARVRGLVDLAINGSFWIGAAAGAALSIVCSSPAVSVPMWVGGLAFAFGAVLTIAICSYGAICPKVRVADDARLPRGGRARGGRHRS